MKRKGSERKRHPHDDMKGFLHAMPVNKKEAFMMLVRTKTNRDLREMKLSASKNGEDDLEKFLDAAATLRVFFEAGVL